MGQNLLPHRLEVSPSRLDENVHIKWFAQRREGEEDDFALGDLQFQVSDLFLHSVSEFL